MGPRFTRRRLDVVGMSEGEGGVDCHVDEGRRGDACLPAPVLSEVAGDHSDRMRVDDQMERSVEKREAALLGFGGAVDGGVFCGANKKPDVREGLGAFLDEGAQNTRREGVSDMLDEPCVHRRDKLGGGEACDEREGGLRDVESREP